MFELFRSPPFSDPSLGELVRSRGLWRGTLQLDSRPIPIALAGNRSAPDPAALAVMREVPSRFPSWRSRIQTALFEHYEPYADARADGSDPGEDADVPVIGSSAAIWPHVSLVFVSVLPRDGTWVTELGYATAWDEEHTVGVRFDAHGFDELCGSVLAP